MKQRYFNLIIKSSVFLSLAFGSIAIAEENPNFDLKIINQNESAYDVDQGFYLEHWLDLKTQLHPSFSFDLGLEAHKPSAPFSLDTNGYGLYQRTLNFEKNGLAIKLGNFYSTFGNGLLLNSRQERDIRWDNNLDGLNVELNKELLNLNFIMATPRNSDATRAIPLTAIDLSTSIFKYLQPGFSWLKYDVDSEAQHYFSFRTNSYWTYGEFLMELAAQNPQDQWEMDIFKEDFEDVFSDGKAFWASLQLFPGNWTFLTEYRYYQNFSIIDGQILNAPPTAIREHIFSLNARKQMVQNSNNEKGVHSEVSYSFDEGSSWPELVTLDYSLVKNFEGQEVYQEIYGQADNAFPLFLFRESLLGLGYQKDLEAWNATLGFELSPNLNLGAFSFRMIYEHQQTQTLLTERLYYSQLASIAITHDYGWVLALSGEHSTDQFEHKNWWGGLAFSGTHWENLNYSIFVGSRRKGKVCTSGICINKPEFFGVELALTSNW